MVRMAASHPLSLRERLLFEPPPGPRRSLCRRMGRSPLRVTAYHPAKDDVDQKLNLCGASHALVWRKSPRMRVGVQGHLTDWQGVATRTANGEGTRRDPR